MQGVHLQICSPRDMGDCIPFKAVTASVTLSSSLSDVLSSFMISGMSVETSETYTLHTRCKEKKLLFFELDFRNDGTLAVMPGCMTKLGKLTKVWLKLIHFLHILDVLSVVEHQYNVCTEQVQKYGITWIGEWQRH